MTHQVIHHPGKQRFELTHGPGPPATLTYHTTADTTIIDHTFVPTHLRGHGIAAILTHHALLEARRLRWKIIPDCSYVETYILKNPEFQALLHTP